LQWHVLPEIYHLIINKKFTMARLAENLPSDNEKEIYHGTPAENVPSDDEKDVYDGTPGQKCAI
jgi:hypothetical protein